MRIQRNATKKKQNEAPHFESLAKQEIETLLREAREKIGKKEYRSAQKIAQHLDSFRANKEAIEIYRLLVKYDSAHIVHRKNLAYLLERVQNYSEAMEYIKEIEGRENQDTSFYDLKMRVLIGLENYDEAIDQLKSRFQVKEINSEIIRFFIAVFWIFKRRDGDLKALKILEYINNLCPADPKIVLVYAPNLEQAGYPTKAEELLLNTLEKNPNNVDLKIAYSVFLNRLHRYEETIEFVNSLRSSNPKLLYAKALALYSISQFSESEDVCVALLGKTPDENQVKLLLSRSYIFQGKCGQARACLRPLLEEPRALWWFLFSYEHEKDFKSALKEAEVFFKDLPKDLGLSLLYSNLLSQQKRFIESEKVLRHALSFNPENAQLLLALAHCLESLSQPDKAEYYFLRTLRLYPKFQDAHHGCARFYQNSGDHSRAEKYFLEAISLFPNEPSFLLGLSIIYYEDNNFASASSLARQALALDNSYASARSMMQKFDLGGKKNPSKKQKEYAAAHRDDPDRINRHIPMEMLNKISSLPKFSAYKNFLVSEKLLEEEKSSESDVEKCIKAKIEFEKQVKDFCGLSDQHNEILTRWLQGSIMKNRTARDRGVYATALSYFEKKNYDKALPRFEQSLKDLQTIIAEVTPLIIEEGVDSRSSPETQVALSSPSPSLEIPEALLSPTPTPEASDSPTESASPSPAPLAHQMDESGISLPPKRAESTQNCLYALFTSCTKLVATALLGDDEKRVENEKKLN